MVRLVHICMLEEGIEWLLLSFSVLHELKVDMRNQVTLTSVAKGNTGSWFQHHTEIWSAADSFCDFFKLKKKTCIVFLVT